VSVTFRSPLLWILVRSIGLAIDRVPFWPNSFRSLMGSDPVRCYFRPSSSGTFFGRVPLGHLFLPSPAVARCIPAIFSFPLSSKRFRVRTPFRFTLIVQRGRSTRSTLFLSPARFLREIFTCFFLGHCDVNPPFSFFSLCPFLGLGNQHSIV